MTVELNTRSFQAAAAGPHLLITAGVHGDEFEPIEAVRRLIDLLDQGDEANELQRGQVTLVPCVNEDAFWRGHRCATDDLDLARTCPGRADGSITEQTAWALSQLIHTADYYIDLHTGGTEFSIYPLAGYVLHSDAAVLETQREMAKAFGLPVVWGTSGKLEGRSLSVARDAGVPAIYCEYGGAATCQEAGVDAYVDGCLNVMKSLQILNGETGSGDPQWFVEDARDDSGHLQVCNPSPIDGLFKPAVALGDEVQAGTLLGQVVALNDSAAHDIHSEHDGVVILLRTFPRVQSGQSIGVILDTTV